MSTQLLFRFDSGAGHYTQVVWAETDEIGCGYTYFSVGLLFSLPSLEIIATNRRKLDHLMHTNLWLCVTMALEEMLLASQCTRQAQHVLLVKKDTPVMEIFVQRTNNFIQK